MDTSSLTPVSIIALADQLPAFPSVVTEVLSLLDNDNASLRALAGHIEHDPVITAKIYALINSAAARSRARKAPHDLYTAISLVGLANIRRIVLAHCTVNFLRDLPKEALSNDFWKHSISVGVCAQELARTCQISHEFALVAGLLHDVGQLWIACFYPEVAKRVRYAIVAQRVNIIDAERQLLGDFNHAEIGALLAAHWGLPASVVAAIRYHHAPEAGLPDPLVAITHVAEISSNALDLGSREHNQVSGLSQEACDLLGINWEEDHSQLFGEIEARTDYACKTLG